jgi:hypothetical protein
MGPRLEVGGVGERRDVRDRTLGIVRHQVHSLAERSCLAGVVLRVGSHLRPFVAEPDLDHLPVPLVFAEAEEVLRVV